MSSEAPTPADPEEAVEAAGLVYVTDEKPGLTRQREGEGFAYFKPDGERVTDEATLARLRRLAIPPAWSDVWICPRATGHLQATGRDARGRKQYRYHPQFRELRESTKYEHMLEFAHALPAIRAQLAEHMALRGLPREKVLATVVHLLETTLIRVGNDEYMRENRSYGLTTLRSRHVKVEGAQLRFQFTGKGGKTWQLQVRDRRVAKVVRACQELPGQELFTYRDESGDVKRVTSSDVNAYLREITGRDVTAKDFRTWAGTVMAAIALQEMDRVDSQAAQKKNLRAAIGRVAARLGNTPTICRKCYIHPQVLDAYVEGELALAAPQETAVLALLEARLARTLEDSLKKSLKKAAVNRAAASRNRRSTAALRARGA